jgi:hypothetical protein
LRVGLNDVKVLWELEFGGGHVVVGRNKTHWGGIT